MENEINTILIDYEKEILEIEQSDFSLYPDVEKGIKISRKYLQKLRLLLRNDQFKNKEDEITFFKHQKPRIYGKLKFYAKLYRFLLQKPRGTNKSQRLYIDREIKILQNYFLQNNEFIKYYRQNATFLDEFYFLRGNDNIGLISDTSHFYTDAEFSTSHDNAVAKIIAYDLLIIYYTNELDKLKKTTRGIPTDTKLFGGFNLTWTSNKIDLVELTYSLIASGSVKGDIKDLATLFEKVYNIDLGNYYRSFLEIRARKENPARFIDELKSKLLKKIEEADD
ncbi:MAG: RteC domain-containing protein [Pricia sp.]